MAEELGKIEKPSVEGYKSGRKLFFVPMVLSQKELPLEIAIKIDHYWDEIESQLSNLEAKLGIVVSIYHELIPEGGEEGVKALKELNLGSYNIVQNRLAKGAKLEATEDNQILTELMDWSRCLSIGLQNQEVVSRIYQYYTEANQKRNEFIARKLNETLKEETAGILIMAEGHHVQFPPDVKVFYVSPPVLDEIKRWLRDNEKKVNESQEKEEGNRS
jgi:hypothetical protein